MATLMESTNTMLRIVLVFRQNALTTNIFHKEKILCISSQKKVLKLNKTLDMTAYSIRGPTHKNLLLTLNS